MLFALISLAVGLAPVCATAGSLPAANEAKEAVYGQGAEAASSETEKAHKEFEVLVKSFFDLDEMESRSTYNELHATGDFIGSYDDWQKRNADFPEEEYIFLGDCGGLIYFGEAESELDNLVHFAYEYYRIQSTLTRAGVPEYAWRPVIDEFARHVIADEALGTARLREWVEAGSGIIPDRPEPASEGESYDYLARIAEDIQSNWKNTSRKIHPGANECGAGEDLIEISTEPVGGSVLLISHFRKLVCEGKGIDPFDTRRCRGWRQVADGSVASVIGDYFYVVRWPGGATARGMIGFDDRRFENAVTITRTGLRRRAAE